jgi:dolichyl-phosphate beta-glucosyltransferase
MKLSVVIPAYNEAHCIQQNISHVCEYCELHFPRHEIIVVSDGSQDQTLALLCELRTKYPKLNVLGETQNHGKGAAVQKGVLAANGDWILCLDADLAVPIEELPRFLTLGQSHDMVIGSRVIPKATQEVRPTLPRLMMSQVFNYLVRTLASLNFKDTQCSLKLYRRDAAHDLFKRMTIQRFAFDVEMLFLARRLGYRIAEVPVHKHGNPHSKVRMPHDPINMLVDVLKMRWRH